MIALLSSVVYGFSDTGSLSLVAKDNQKTIKLVEWNSENRVGLDHITTIFKEFDADIAIFPELAGPYGSEQPSTRLKQLFRQNNLEVEDYQFFVSKRLYDFRTAMSPVTVVIKKEFGLYKVKDYQRMVTFGTIYLQPAESDRL